MVEERHGRGMGTACYVWIGLKNTGSKGEGTVLKTNRIFFLSVCAILQSFLKDCRETSSWRHTHPPLAVTGYHNYVTHFWLLYRTYGPAVEFLLVCAVSFAVYKTAASNYSLRALLCLRAVSFPLRRSILRAEVIRKTHLGRNYRWKSKNITWPRRTEKIWTNIVKNEVLQRVKEESNVLQVIQRRKANWISHYLRRTCLLKHAIDGKIEGSIEVTGRRWRRCKQLLIDLKETEDTGNWKREHWIAHCGELALEEAVDLSEERDSKMNEPSSLYKFTCIHESAVFNL